MTISLGYTPCMIASIIGNEEILGLILQKDPDLLIVEFR